MKWRTSRERRRTQKKTLQESGEDQRRSKQKGIVKRLILLNCSLILAPEKDPRGWKGPNQRIQRDQGKKNIEKDLKK